MAGDNTLLHDHIESYNIYCELLNYILIECFKLTATSYIQISFWKQSVMGFT